MPSPVGVAPSHSYLADGVRRSSPVSDHAVAEQRDGLSPHNRANCRLARGPRSRDIDGTRHGSERAPPIESCVRDGTELLGITATRDVRAYDLTFG